MLERLQVKTLPVIARAQDAAPIALCCKECAQASAAGLAGVGLVAFRRRIQDLPKRLRRR